MAGWVVAVIPQAPGWLLYVRFEQGRGQTGVPKVTIPYWQQHRGQDTQVETFVRMAVECFRAQCADPVHHGQDLMPGTWRDYELHDLDGQRIIRHDGFKWQDMANGGGKCSEVVLTWHNPANLLIAHVRQTRGSEAA